MEPQRQDPHTTTLQSTVVPASPINRNHQTTTPFQQKPSHYLTATPPCRNINSVTPQECHRRTTTLLQHHTTTATKRPLYMGTAAPTHCQPLKNEGESPPVTGFLSSGNPHGSLLLQRSVEDTSSKNLDVAMWTQGKKSSEMKKKKNRKLVEMCKWKGKLRTF